MITGALGKLIYLAAAVVFVLGQDDHVALGLLALGLGLRVEALGG